MLGLTVEGFRESRRGDERGIVGRNQEHGWVERDEKHQGSAWVWKR